MAARGAAEGSRSPPLPPGAEPVPAAPVSYAGIAGGLQWWLPNLEGFWLQQPVRKSCKVLLF